MSLQRFLRRKFNAFSRIAAISFLRIKKDMAATKIHGKTQKLILPNFGLWLGPHKDISVSLIIKMLPKFENWNTASVANFIGIRPLFTIKNNY